MKRKHKLSAKKPIDESSVLQADEDGEQRGRNWKAFLTAALGLTALLVAMFFAFPDYTGPRHSKAADKTKPEYESAAPVDDAGVSCTLLMDQAQAILERHPIPNNEWEKALDLLATCVVQEPDNPTPKWKLAVGLMQMGRVDQAVAFLDEAVGPTGKNIDLLKSGGTVFSAHGYHEEAIRCLEAYLAFVTKAPSWDQLLVNLLQQPSDQWTFLYDAAKDVVQILEVLLHSYLQGVSLVKGGYVYRVIIALKGPENCPELLQSYSSFAFGLGDLSTGIKYLRMYTELQYISQGYGGQIEAYEVVTAHSLRLLMAGADSHIVLIAKNLLHFGQPVWEELEYNCALLNTDMIDFKTAVRLSQITTIYLKCLSVQKLVGNLGDEGAVAYSENRFGWTPFLHAAALGDSTLISRLLTLHADPQTRTTIGHTSLHVAAVRGTYDTVPALLQAGVRSGDRDYFNRTALDVACLHRWSAAQMAHAMSTKMPNKCPSPLTYTPPIRPIMQGGWLGSGSVLPSSLTDERCDIDVMATPNITTFIFDYLSLGRPVLVRKASDSNLKEFYQTYQRMKMETEHGSLRLHKLHTSYWEGREGDGSNSYVTLKAFLASMRQVFQEHKEIGRAEGVTPPDYVFERLPNHSPLLSHFELPSILSPNHTHILPTHTYLYIGPSLSGENIYFHKSSWSLLIYGQRRLFLLPPAKAFYSKRLIWDWWKDHNTQKQGILECVQYPGDLLFVPDMWAVGAINLRESIGLKSEFVHGSSEFSI